MLRMFAFRSLYSVTTKPGGVFIDFSYRRNCVEVPSKADRLAVCFRLEA
jgi:hypothetical protein